MFWRTVGRIVWVPIAFLLSGAFALFILFSLGMERITEAMHNTGGDLNEFDVVLRLAESGFLLASGLTLIPAVALVIIGEVARIRSSVYYIIGGGMALVTIPLLSRLGDTATFTMPEMATWQIFATAGFAGGLAYWALAGRRA